MTPSSAQTLAGLLKSQASAQPAKETTSEESRPTREKKLAALEKKVWLNKPQRQSAGNNSAAKRSAPANGGENPSKKPKQVSRTDHTDVKKNSQRKKNSTKKQTAAEVEEGLEEIDELDDPSFVVEDDDANEDDGEVFDISEKELAEEQVKVVGKKGKSAVNLFDDNSDGECIVPAKHTPSFLPNIDDSKSDASSAVDMSMLPPSDDEDDSDSANVQPKARRTKTLARDAKYTAELPSMVPFVNDKPKAKSGVRGRAALKTNPNDGWPESTYLVYPTEQRTISINAQQQNIKDVLHEAITLAMGISIFRHAFAPSDKQLADSRNSILSAAQTRKEVLIADRFEHDSGFAKHLTNYVTGRVGTMRGKVKEVAQELVPSLYGLHQVPVANDGRKKFVEDLLSRLNYIFPRTMLMDATTTRTNEPYRHPAIIAVLHKFFFTGRKSLGRRFSETFSSISDADDAKEIPQAMLGLVSVAIFAALKEWSEGKDQRKNEEFISSQFSDQYELHMLFFKSKILKVDGSGKAKYRTLMSRLYREANSDSADVKSDASNLPDLDFNGMEE